MATASVVQPPVQQPIVPKRQSEHCEKALEILRQQRQADPAEMLKLSQLLKAELKFSYARRLLARARNHKDIDTDPNRVRIFQQLALCTYKDEDLPADERLDAALRTLGEIADFETTKDQETLGLIGAIYKRKWEIDNQRENLERALFYYMRGYDEGPRTDQGYTGINAAFVLDRLASLEEREAVKAGDSSAVASGRREKAHAIRKDVVDQVGALIADPEHDGVADAWWYYATLAEAHFGLEEYDEAVAWIQRGQAAAKTIYEWELETCARQLAAIARLQLGEERELTDFEFTPAWTALERAFGAEAVPHTAFAGKIGLALSGGGFRASLYHLGVLARLAELDILRRVDVLSCVSGGSIVGAYYYLKVRKLLETRTDSDIRREDYVQIVHEMIEEFVAGVKLNIRTRVAVNPIKNFRMFWSEKYSRTARAAELYDKHLYALVKDGHRNGERKLNELTISPLTNRTTGNPEKDSEFSPKYQNWRRNAKVPILVLNAATLNTGHTWQFTATWMGEAPGAIDSEIDGNDRLRRMYYGQAPSGYNEVSLGQAVGASAAVPGVFEPLTMDNLYPDRIVRLVDGGVTDNQGVATLLEQDCRVVLVSDASGQMESQLASSRGIVGNLLRTNDIFQARIRQTQYQNLKARRRSNLLRGFMFVHLKGGLDVNPIDWTDTRDPYNPVDDVRPPASRRSTTPYEIDKEIQQRLSVLRTDLDSFSEAEAYALMTSAYRMTEYQIREEKCVEGFVEPAKKESWKFLEIEDCMKGSGKGYEYLKKLLTAGNSAAFRVWKISPFLKVVRYVLAALSLIGIAAAAYAFWSDPLPQAISQPGTSFLNSLAQGLEQLTVQKVVTYLVWMAGSAVAVYLLVKLLEWAVGTFMAGNVMMVVHWKDTVRRIILVSIVSTVGCVAAVIHLYIFDKWFLRLGSLKAVKAKNA
jgi:predicted acylesterase/phospholipase RssA